MLRIALSSLALVATLSGCASPPLQVGTEPPKVRSKYCGSDCELNIIVGAKAPRGGSAPGANDCTAVTFTLDGQAFEHLVMAPGARAVLNFALDGNTKGFAFFGSNPVSLYNADKTGPAESSGLNGQVQISRVARDGFTFTMVVLPNTSGKKEEFHFGVALGTSKGGCAGDPRVTNG